MNNTFSIDLTALYEYIGDGETEYGYYIDHEEDGVNVWNDLRQSSPNTLFACDGETCMYVDDFTDVVCVYNTDYDNDRQIPFWLSKEEFALCSNLTLE